MASTLTQILLHITFSTKNREPTIDASVEPDLYAYIGGICRGLHSPLMAMGGAADHVHLLVSLSKTISTADLLLDIKRDSSKSSRGYRGAIPPAIDGQPSGLIPAPHPDGRRPHRPWPAVERSNTANPAALLMPPP